MVRFETQFDSQVTKQLNKHTFKTKWWLFVIFPVIMIGCGLLTLLDPVDPDIGFSIYLIAVGVLFIPIVLLLTHFLQKRMDKSMHLLSENTKELYLFDTDHFEIIQDMGEEYFAHTKGKYNHFYKIVKTPTHYYLYISKAQSHVVPVSSLTEGTLEELDALLKANIAPSQLKGF